MNDIFANAQNSTKAAVDFAEISTTAFTEILNNQVALVNELVGASLGQLKRVQAAQDVTTVFEYTKTFGTDLESKVRKVAGENLKVIEDSSKKAYDLFTKQAKVATPASSK